MKNELINYLEQYVSLKNEERYFIEDNIEIKKFSKNKLLLSENEVSNEFYFIIEGAIRLFYNIGIEEKSAYFYFENTFVSSYESFTKRTPSKHNLMTIEDTRVAIISFDIAQTLLSNFPRFEFLARIMMEEELIIYQNIISTFVTMNAEDRYMNLVETKSELIERVPQYLLASYLGVTPETLSRIRKKIK